MGVSYFRKKAYIGLTIVTALASIQSRTLIQSSYSLTSDEHATNASASVNSKSTPMRYLRIQNVSEICPEEETIIYIISKAVNYCFKYPQRILHRDLYPHSATLINIFFLTYSFIIIESFKRKISALAIPYGGHAPPVGI